MHAGHLAVRGAMICRWGLVALFALDSCWHQTLVAFAEDADALDVIIPALQQKSQQLLEDDTAVTIPALQQKSQQPLEDDTAGAEERLLAEIGPTLPDNASLTLSPASGSPLVCKPNANPPCTYLRNVLYAGLAINKLEVIVEPDTFGGGGSKLRLVRGHVTKAMADAGACLAEDFVNGVHDARVSDPWGPSGVDTTKTGGVLEAKGSLTFRQGGSYKICYSDDGSFQQGHVDLVGIMLYINGVYDTSDTVCAGRNSCLPNKEYFCYLMMNQYNNMENSYYHTTSCVVNYDNANSNFEGAPGKGSWTAPFIPDYDADGTIRTNADGSLKISAASCGPSNTAPADFLCQSGAGSCDQGVPYFLPDAAYSQKRMNMPTGRNDLDGTKFSAYMVAACYCPDYDDCNMPQDFLQQVGILYYFATKICGHGYDATTCDPFFAGSAPQYRFAVRVECPGGACSEFGTSRMKIVSQAAANDLPSWDNQNGCFSAVHGRNSINEVVLAPEVNLDVSDLHGGERQDYKLWNFRNGSFDVSTSGFMFKMGTTDHELRNFHGGETFDICFCDASCNVPRNWFKVGALRLAPFQLVSSALNISSLQKDFAIEYVNQEGILGFYRPPIDYGVMGLQENGILKLVEDNAMAMDDEGCQDAPYNRDLVAWESLSATSGPLKHSGRKNDLDPDRLVFNSMNLNNRLTVKLAGAIAICYCARVVDNVCANNQWVLASRMTIRGPTPNQHWEFSTHVVFRFNYTGWGLSKDNMMRIIPPTSNCEDDLRDPNGAYTETDIKMQCPDPCSEVGGPKDVVNGDISSIVLADDHYMCDNQNADCRNNDIKKMQILNNQTTELEFEAPPYLQDGDLLTLGDNFICDPTDASCTPERLSVLKGRYRYIDQVDNNENAPDEYIAGHAVTTDPTNPKKITIPVGWPDPVPRFQVAYANNKRGRWTRHNRAITKEEILGTRERKNLKVCWKFPAPLGEFVTQVGTLTLMDPNPMQACIISLMTTVKRQKAPLVLSFQTASAQTGKRYASVQGHTQLRLVFTRTLAIDIAFVDDANIENNAGEDEISEARQYVCGKLFKELWSSDQELGFPMPKGCYHRSYGMTRELTMLFEKRSGLRAGFDYQVVLNGVAQEEAVVNGQYAQIFAMDDTELKPYEAIERGIARLAETPQDPAYGSNGVRFLEPDGFKIVRGTGANMYEVKGGAPLYAELRGEPTGGGITANSLLRIYLWPLTQWDVATQCIAECIPYDQVSAPCGAIQSCMGEAVVSNFQKNFIKLRLPTTMETASTELFQTLVLMDLVLPKGGFFPTRFAAQISKSDDTKPHYITSVGDFFFKEPDEGQTIGKLVNLYGDGNHKPFREQKGNVLYANIILATTLFAAVQTGDATMTIRLPPGYECTRPVDIDGRSPWEAEETLSVFGTTIPQGRGTPDEGSGTRGWVVNANECTYVLRQNGVIYAGSSLFFRITVNNPADSIKRENTTNRWQIILRSKGYHQWSVPFPPVAFANAGIGGAPGTENFAENAAVLGRIKEAYMVPSTFAASISQFQIAESHLHFFFKTQQETGVNGYVQVVPPPGFVFHTQCKASDLFESYYATDVEEYTRRLPGIISCDYITTPFKRAEVGLIGSLVADTWYAFKITVQHPALYNVTQQGEWQLFTLTGSRYRVDGTPETVKLAPIPDSAIGENITNISYGMYQYALNTPDIRRVEVAVESLYPYSLSGAVTKVTVHPLQIPVTASTTLRIIAPLGFEWDFQDSQFVKEGTEDFPGGVPIRDQNVLIWNKATYEDTKTYGFKAFIRVPDHSPTSSVNAFIIEFGFESPFFSERIAAAVVDLRQVSALVNARVDYTNNVESKDNAMIFQVQTVTNIPQGGYIEIIGPENFRFPADEVLTQTNGDETTPAPAPPQPKLAKAPEQRGSPYEVSAVRGTSLMLPVNVQCQGTSALDQKVVINIVAGATGIPPGLYRFQITLQNPDRIVPNPPSIATQCGFRNCWSFTSKTSGGGQLDLGTTVPSFPVNRKLVEALIPTLTPTQRRLTFRDDRPLHLNPLIFAFKLNRAAVDPGYMKIRAPLGFVFREECLSDIEWRGFMVFGEPLGAQYTAWDAGVAILSCRGEGPDAMIYIDPGSSPGLQPELLYPFRITLVANPAYDPTVNRWSIEYAGESSDPFIGFPLYTFSRLSVTTVSTAKSSPQAGAVWLRNPVTFTFCPYNTITGSLMKIKVTAPPNYEIAHVDLMCTIMMQPLGPVDPTKMTAAPTNFTAPPSMRWGEADVECKVNPLDRRFMTATVLAASRMLSAGYNYQLTVFVYNPTIVVANANYMWKLETEAGPQHPAPSFRDLSNIPGYTVNERMKIWLVRNEDPVTRLPYLNGKTVVPGLFFEMRFPMKLEYEDYIEIEAPAGFILEGPPPQSAAAAQVQGATCNNWRWEPPEAKADYLHASVVSCSGGRMTIVVLEEKPFPELQQLKWRMDTKNVAKTPHIMLNHWKCTHKMKTGVIRSSDAQLSWNIRPQLENVQIALTGQEKAESSKSAMQIAFVPVSDADELYLEAKLPSGFDFTGAASSSLGNEVIETSVEKIRVRCALYADVPAVIRLEKFKLGRIGGATKFDLITKLNNGLQMDEKLDYVGGFRLPGRVTVLEQKMYSDYQLNPSLYPVPSLWGSRMQEKARAVFIFSLTLQADIGTSIRMSAPPYFFIADYFQIIDVATNAQVHTQVLDRGHGRVRAVLHGPLWANAQWEIGVNVLTPSVPNPTDAMWTINILDTNPLPVNTNDALTEGFQLVYQLEFSVRAGRSPPEAEIQAELNFDPKGTLPNEILLVAPDAFNFTENCLHDGGTTGEILTCERTLPVAGREAALIRGLETGITRPPQYLVIKIVTPSQSAEEPSWFMQARNYVTGKELGWGTDPIGVEVRQMRGAGVIFPGIPGISGQMAFKFETNVKVDEDGLIRVGYPKSITVSCEGGFLHKVALKGDVRCTNQPREGYFELSLPRPLPPGRQAFAVTSTAPNAVNDPGGNMFYIKVIGPPDQGRNVIDARMNIPGMRIQHGLKVSALPLVWGSSEASRPATVSLGFELLEDLPENQPPVISELILMVPQDFYQSIRRVSQVQIMNDPLPKRPGQWLHYDNPKYLKVLLDEKYTPTLAPGSYRIQFPAWVPARIPNNNVWLLVLCKPGPGDCVTLDNMPNPNRSLVSFPLAGFELNEEHPSMKQKSNVDAARHIHAGSILGALVAGLVSVLTMS